MRAGEVWRSGREVGRAAGSVLEAGTCCSARKSGVLGAGGTTCALLGAQVHG